MLRNSRFGTNAGIGESIAVNEQIVAYIVKN